MLRTITSLLFIVVFIQFGIARGDDFSEYGKSELDKNTELRELVCSQSHITSLLPDKQSLKVDATSLLSSALLGCASSVNRFKEKQKHEVKTLRDILTTQCSAKHVGETVNRLVVGKNLGESFEIVSQLSEITAQACMSAIKFLYHKSTAPKITQENIQGVWKQNISSEVVAFNFLEYLGDRSFHQGFSVKEKFISLPESEIDTYRINGNLIYYSVSGNDDDFISVQISIDNGKLNLHYFNGRNYTYTRLSNEELAIYRDIFSKYIQQQIRSSWREMGQSRNRNKSRYNKGLAQFVKAVSMDKKFNSLNASSNELAKITDWSPEDVNGFETQTLLI